MAATIGTKQVGASLGQVLGGIAATGVVGGVFYYLTAKSKIFGGTHVRTQTDEWAAATKERLLKAPREAGPPVIMNAITRRAEQMS
eukprot:jgi/Chlat1/7930/Chrsp68S07364